MNLYTLSFYMEQYEWVLDLALLEELPKEEARAYLVWKYGVDFAKKAFDLMEAQDAKNNQQNTYEN